MSKSVKYSCEKCAKTFSQKSHYDQHINRKKLCDIQTDKIQALIDKSVEEKVNELNKKLILNNTSISNDITHNTIMEGTKTEPIVSDIEVKNMDGLQYLSTIPDGSVDLILTDPPYIISKDSGMNTHYNKVKHNEANNIEFVKTEEEWVKYKK